MRAKLIGRKKGAQHPLDAHHVELRCAHRGLMKVTLAVIGVPSFYLSRDPALDFFVSIRDGYKGRKGKSMLPQEMFGIAEEKSREIKVLDAFSTPSEGRNVASLDAGLRNHLLLLGMPP
ncbi:hypothetical protein VNO78_22426 [Psophocarpus tetragonolobus]|uniref:Uncharacterized protein n=1 Tax=Psophocarpus tetragonolobus TaxID=3891 RepID=A0AAN9S4N1_PSOTE